MTSVAVLTTLKMRGDVTRPKPHADGTVTYIDVALNVRCMVSDDDYLDAQVLVASSTLKRSGVCLFPASLASVIKAGDYVKVKNRGTYTITGKIRTVLDAMGQPSHVEAWVNQL